ncbi:MAG: YkgJ family cysteine cluster protein [Deltaproteobacteria bacterium]|nr:YkgJ family cysteine cluster protein [Deltaproteobacteria bacterium]
METFDFAQYQGRVRAAVGRSFSGGVSLDRLLGRLQQLAGEADGYIDQFMAGDRSLIDCGPGCSDCCVVNVSTLFPEGIAITRFIRRQEPEQVQQLSARLETLWREVRGLDDEDRLFMRRRCAFLDETGCCSIYPVRPLLCRSISSTDAESCRDALTAKVFGDEKPVLMHQFQQQLFETLFTGFAEGLEAAGVDGRSCQLTGLVRYLLRHPGVENELLAGRRLAWRDLF